MIGLMTSESTRLSCRGCHELKLVSTFGSGIELSVGDTIVTVVSSSKLGSKSKSSVESVSSASDSEPIGGVAGLAFAFLLRFPLPFPEMIEFAHDFTFRGLSLRDDFDFSASLATASWSLGDVAGDWKDLDKAGSEMLVGSVRMGVSLWRDSNLKNGRRFVGTLAIGEVGDIGEIADIGLFIVTGSPLSEDPMNLSRTAPAVLGRPSSSTVLNEVRPALAACGPVPLTIEDKLFVAECPRIVDNDVSVSEEMVESGRMYSTRSENPTRALDGGRALESSDVLLSRSEGWEMERLNL